MRKSEILLFLFHQLHTGKPVSRAAFCSDTHISERSFYRYLNDIRNFIVEFGLPKELREEGGNYYLADV